VAHVILFSETALFGEHRHVFAAQQNLGIDIANRSNEATQSFWILDGHWQFFREGKFKTPFPVGSGTPIVLGPGAYRNIKQALGPASAGNIASLRPVEFCDGAWVPLPAREADDALLDQQSPV
jgi:hypothetical protein